MKKQKKKDLSYKEYEALLEQLCVDDCDGKDCFFKEMLICLHPMPRLLVQLKCISRFRKQLVKEKGKEISSSDAVAEWVERGYAEKFAESYNEEKTFSQIYKETIGS